MASFLGIDPGANGAYALHSPDGWIVEDLPHTEEGAFDAAALYHRLLTAGPLVVALERPLPFTISNADSMLKLGQSYGALLACVSILPDSRVLTPTARSWKAAMGLTSEKGVSVARAREVLEFGPKQRLRHDKAEAVLLAVWAGRQPM
ncbi:hypothetical protein [Burkholderia cepacia]|uniref:hypothetical protein n=1 Tax=Burkholderia cepacia TaxID=292 RepID=UPI000756FAB4|nr:hypothetical protein [Burkholderia cepacia]KWF99082.1 hypothetical protein WL95_00260 [Burkholderia cepacia]